MALDVTQLLAVLRRENARENDGGVLAQVVAKPEPMPRAIATLDGKTRPLTPMLRARFAFAGRWDNATLSQTWLPASRMARAPRDRRLMQQVALRRENFTRSPVAKLPLGRLSLFAVSDNGDETYLVWRAGREPELRLFSGVSEFVYRDLAALLRAHIGPAALRLDGNDAAPAPSTDLAAHLADDARRLDAWIAGLERWGQPTLARAALALAGVALPSLPPDKRRAMQAMLAPVRAWAERARGELPEAAWRGIHRARPIAPEIEGKRTWELMHACCQAASAASPYHLENPPVLYSDGVRDALLDLRRQKPAAVAAALNAAKLKTPAGSAWTAPTAETALRRFEYTLEHARSSATAAVGHLIVALGKGVAPELRAAVRQALAPRGKKNVRAARRAAR